MIREYPYRSSWAMNYDYETIVRIYKESVNRPESINPQVWRRIKRVARSHKLMRISPDVLPESLSALIELTKLPVERLERLERNGLLGKGMTPERVKQIGPEGPVQAMMYVTLHDDDRIEFGATVPAAGPIHRLY
jgi:hypothetical protein